MTTDELIAKLTEACHSAKEWLDHTVKLNGPIAGDVSIFRQLEDALALARQHKTWRHLDRDAEKPCNGDVVLVWSEDCRWLTACYQAETNSFYDGIDGNPRWWKPLDAPPKD